MRRSSPSRGVTEQGRMLQAKAEAAGALCGTGRTPRCRCGVARCWRQQRGVAAPSMLSGGQGAVQAAARDKVAPSTMHAPIGAVLPVPGQGAGRAAPS